jgi:ComF family protein
MDAMLAFRSAHPAVWLSSLQTAALDLIFPPRCVHCERPGSLLCHHCAQAAEPIGAAICAQCGRRQKEPIAQCATCEQQPERALGLARAATLHRGPIRAAAHELKYGGATALAPLLARYLVAAFALPPWPLLYRRIHGVTPVPLHAERRKERGYNQAELLAAAFCRQTGLPLHPEWLHRQRLTRSQVGLHFHERQANVADAFVAPPTVQGKVILLIDDVYTTGATLNACATALRSAGALAVHALALAAPDRPDADG